MSSEQEHCCGESGEEAASCVIPGRAVRMAADTVRVGAAPGGAKQAQVEVIREGGQVTAIDVTCPCGRKLRLYCVY